MNVCRKIIIIFICALMLFKIPSHIFAEDNAGSGDGDTGVVKGKGFYICWE